MKLKVKINEKVFEVEIGDLRERPIVATVDGETFEVWPESKATYTAQTSRPNRLETPVSESGAVTPVLTPRATPGASLSNDGGKTVRAPIPGVITIVLVQPGDHVSVGQELCKLEAMKMNNSIRSNREGQIIAIRVSAGQQVKHNEVLIEFA